MGTADIRDAYPGLEQRDIAEVLQYAATLTEDRVIPHSPSGS